jgi:secondary thiamine-phosphate synthase enzyme
MPAAGAPYTAPGQKLLLRPAAFLEREFHLSSHPRSRAALRMAVTARRLARMHGVWIQQQVTLRPRPRGFHLVTDEIVDGVPELASLEVGMALVFLRHTSASLTINENASPEVRRDFAAWFDRAVPDGADYFAHTLEGPDDMPAHIKSSLTGASLVLPVRDGRLALGTWQGIYLCEHRNDGGPREVLVTAYGCANMRSCAGTT